jgi:hypothetical protein
MNKRIQELINLSTERVELNIRGDDTIDTEMVFNKEKFAELIIKKCVNIAETYDLLLDEDDRECCICRKVAWRIADNINSEFGIE